MENNIELNKSLNNLTDSKLYYRRTRMTKPVKQLIVDKDNQQEFYPNQLMGNVLDGEGGENLYAYLSKFNHINVGYVANAVAARNAIPQIFRKNGFYITYYINDKPTTEIYIGSNENASNPDTWVLDSNWKFSDGVGFVESNSITLDKLSKEVLELIGNSNTNIINYPDGEDLIQIDICNGQAINKVNILKFADKEYNPANFSGLGRIYLRKNIIDGKNILTQDMINKSNVRYIIQYDYDLNGEEITIPDNCILYFQGGSLNNGSIHFYYTTLENNININCTFDGVINNKIIKPNWFGFIPNDENSAEYNATVLKQCVRLMYTIGDKNESSIYCNKTIEFDYGRYYIKGNNLLWLNRTEILNLPYSKNRYRSGAQFIGKGKNSTILEFISIDNNTWIGSNEDSNYSNNSGEENGLIIDNKDTSAIDNVQFKDITFNGDNKINGFYWRSYGWEKHILFENCSFNNINKVFNLIGYGNTDHNRWINCDFNINEYCWFINNNQCVDTSIIACSIITNKNVFKIGKYGGGDVTFTGGSIILNSNNNSIGSVIYRQATTQNSGIGSGNGNNQFVFNHIRLETYGNNKHIAYSEKGTLYGSLYVIYNDCSFTVVRNSENTAIESNNNSITLNNDDVCILNRCQLHYGNFYKIVDCNGKIYFNDCFYTTENISANPLLLKSKCSIENSNNSNPNIICKNLNTLNIINNNTFYIKGYDFSIGNAIFDTGNKIYTKFLYPSNRTAARIYIIPNAKIKSIWFYRPIINIEQAVNQIIKILSGSEIIYSTVGNIDESKEINTCITFDNFPIIKEYPNNYITMNVAGKASDINNIKDKYIEMVIEYF